MSFTLYFAGGQAKAVEEILMQKNFSKLCSQEYDRKTAEMWLNYSKEVEHRNIFIDSGAFSAWSKGKPLDVDNYIEFLNKNSEAFTAFASIDNIPGELTRAATLKEREESPMLSWENYLYMRERINEKDKLVPTFHAGEDLKHLSNLLEVKLDNKHIPYIALGGTVGATMNYKKKWYSTCFKVISESSNPNVKVHAFGMTAFDVLESFPFYSADSTSWIMTTANGNLMTDYGIVAITERSNHKPNYIGKLPLTIQENIKSQLAKYELSLEECAEVFNTRELANAYYLHDRAKNYKFKGNNRYQKRLF